MKRFKLLPLICGVVLATAALTSCSRAASNVRVLNTTNCGKSWELIPTGSRIPANTGNWCGYYITLPDYPMQGSTDFLTQFQNNVLVKVNITYDYQITDPIKFIDNAKFLGRAKAVSNDDGTDQGGGQYESAENVVIDVRIREAVTNMTKEKDIVAFNPSTFEDELFKQANEILKERGVTLNSMTFVTLPEDQTRMAIDAATAIAVYDSKGMSELGRQLAVARAGATRVEVHAK